MRYINRKIHVKVGEGRAVLNALVNMGYSMRYYTSRDHEFDNYREYYLFIDVRGNVTYSHNHVHFYMHKYQLLPVVELLNPVDYEIY